MGLFDLFKKKNNIPTKEEIEKEMYEKNIIGYRDKKDKQDYEDNLLQKVNAANEKYEADGNLNEIIKVYEFAFYESDPPCVSSQNLKLVDFYLKNNQNDKACGYLNFLYTGSHAPKDKIRFLQAKILKQEGKYDQAIEMFMLGHLLKSEWNKTLNKEMFLKDIKSSANKLKWDSDKLEYLAYLIENQVSNNSFDETALRNSYRKAYEDFTK